MSAGKKSQVKSSNTRLYTRGAMLTSAVVFCGIAIAQAQKGGDPSADQLTVPETAITAGRPIPAGEQIDGPHERAALSMDVAAASYEIPLEDSADGSYETDKNQTIADSSLSAEPPSLPHDQAFDAAANANDVPPPMLPDPSGFPADDPLPTVGQADPYEETDDAYTESYAETDEFTADHDFNSGDPTNNEISLPDLDAVPVQAAAAAELLESDQTYEAPPQPGMSSEPDSAFPEPTPEPAAFDPLPVVDHSYTDASDPMEGIPSTAEASSSYQPASDFQQPSEFDPTSATPQPLRNSEADEPSSRYATPSAEVPASRFSDPIPNGGVAPNASTVPEGDAVPGAAHASPTDEAAAYSAPNPLDQRMASSAQLPQEAIGKPGPQTLEGPQSPSLTVHKVAPQEIQVGRNVKFETRVRNIGRVPAEGVMIRDEIPAGTTFVEATPTASRSADGAIYWEVGSMAPGQEISVAMELTPNAEGQVGSVATVSFQTSASARTRVTKPELSLEHTGPLKVLLGDAVQFSIKLTNSGSGSATQVVLEESVPTGLAHSSGARLEYEVGTIEPGQSRHLELTLKADQAGHVVNTISASANGGIQVEDSFELDVVAPELKVNIDGPARRYLDRQATFIVAVANPGTAPARNVELVAKLPTGLKFISTNNSGYYDQNRHAVIWSLEQLPAGEMGKAQFTAMPVEMGSYQIHAEGHADVELESKKAHDISVEGIAALFFGLADKVDPIEVGGQTSYEIKVVNQGSKTATNVQFVAQVPDGMTTVAASGPTQEMIEGQRLMFAPLERLAPQEEVTFQITVTGQAAGDHRFRVQMTSDETNVPVIKEESTRVYAD